MLTGTHHTRGRHRRQHAATRLAAFALILILSALPALPQNSAVRPPASANVARPTAPARSGPPPDKPRAQKAYQAGRAAELAGDWAHAFTAYSEATSYGPDNREYPLLREHARFQTVQALLDVAARQVLKGDEDGARAQLTRALQLDPNYPVTRERLASLAADPLSAAQDNEQLIPRLAGAAKLTPASGTRDFDFRGTTRTAYEEIGKQFGVSVAFDGDLQDRAIRFEAPKVTFEMAVAVLERQTKTFTLAADAHTLFVTDDTAQKVREFAPEVEKDIILPASVTPEEMNETVRMVREMTGITRTQLNTAARTLSVRSTQKNVALAEALVQQIEQGHGEMLLEVEILELNRNAAHQLGITPPTSAKILTLSLSEILQLQQAQNNGSLLQVLQTIFGSASALAAITGGAGAALPALIAFGGGKTIFLATVPGASVNFSQTLGAVRSARRILLRAQDGKPATFFVGDRYPVSLNSLSAGTNSVSSALTVGVLAGLLPRADYPVGTSPVALALADFNGDGKQDLVTANQANGTISILPGSANGTFGQQTEITVGRGPSSVAIGDFNGDNNVDIAVTNQTDNTVSILLGKGDGTFSAAVHYPTGAGPVALLVRDFNGDAHPDLATVNQADGSVSILLNKGDGTFAGKTDYLVGALPTAIDSADFNADGVADLAVTNRTGNNVSILLGRTNGTFSTKNDFGAGSGPAGVAIADFNRDGRPDLAITNQTDSTVSILLGNSDGTFGRPANFPTGNGPTAIITADFTGDGVPDLIVADPSANDMSVLIGNGDGTFTAPVSVPTANSPGALVAADLNADGALDVVAANQGSNSVTVTLNIPQQSGTSSAPQNAYPASEYVDLGLKVKVIPRLHENNEVTLQLQFDIRSLAGSSINNIPILSNRTIEQTLRLREDQTSVLSGIVHSSETRTVSGWPWTSNLPLVGYLTGEHSGDTQDTEMLIIVTPRALRLPAHSPAAIYAGRGEPASGGGAEPPQTFGPPAGAPPAGGAPGTQPSGAPPPQPPGIQPGSRPGISGQPQPAPVGP